MVHIQVGPEKLEVTGNHPFWVSEGQDLESRPEVEESLAARENSKLQGKGRWVNSQDILSGDKVLTHSGISQNVDATSFVEVEDQPVFNLTVENQHNFAVTRTSILVHNAVKFCDVLKKAFGKDTYDEVRKKLAKHFGVEERFIHAHHIIQKKVPVQWVDNINVPDASGKLKPIQKFKKPLDSWDSELKEAWFIGKSHKKLTGLGMADELLIDPAKASKLADAAADGGRPLHNLRLAINGKGTHTWQTQEKVWEQIKNARSQKAVRKALDKIGDHFEAGDIIAEVL